jgi:membrane fusion protein (multidrug efflux system)
MMVYQSLMSGYERTDNAYTTSKVSEISAQRSGKIVNLLASENQYVQAGDLLLELDGQASALTLAVKATQLAQAFIVVKTAQSPLGVDDPLIQEAFSEYVLAYLDHAYRLIKSPVSGYVTKLDVSLGETIDAGSPLMILVPVKNMMVVANFKETQLRKIRLGQKAEIYSDYYGKKTVFHGTVSSIASSTGVLFSVLPPQNATGNWMKVVQRVPVRIALDPKELSEYPLMMGLSMNVMVDTLTPIPSTSLDALETLSAQDKDHYDSSIDLKPTRDVFYKLQKQHFPSVALSE